jgi:hypothetical protein
VRAALSGWMVNEPLTVRRTPADARSLVHQCTSQARGSACVQTAGDTASRQHQPLHQKCIRRIVEAHLHGSDIGLTETGVLEQDVQVKPRHSALGNRKHVGRPRIPPQKEAAIRRDLMAGRSLRSTIKAHGVGSRPRGAGGPGSGVAATSGVSKVASSMPASRADQLQAAIVAMCAACQSGGPADGFPRAAVTA